jgi:pimeloyl-ACP methyl ester carboxylesterase
MQGASAKANRAGIELGYSVQGDGPETVLLIQGLGARAADWGPALPRALAERFRVVMFDNRGTGSSSRPREAWTLEDMALDALAVLDSVGAERAHVVGVSMGGMIAQLIALDHASRVERLVFLSTNAGGRSAVHPGPEMLSVFQPPRGTPPEQIMRHALELIGAPGWAASHPSEVEELVRLSVEQPTPKYAFSAQLQALLSSDRSERVRDIAQPTLVIHGDADRLIPVQNGRLLAERIPGARLAILDGVGHMAMWEAPERLSRVVVDFLAGG